MNKQLLIKLLSIALVALLIIIPLTMTRAKINERAGLRDMARADIAQSWTGEQNIAGPVIAVSYREKNRVSRKSADGLRMETTEQIRYRRLLIEPQSLTVAARLRSETRYKGIYQIPVYTAALSLSGHFDGQSIARRIERLRQGENFVSLGTVRLVMGISDPRGLNKVAKADWNGREYSLSPGTKNAWPERGLHLPVNVSKLAAESRVPFAMNLELRGMQSIGFLPAGKHTGITVESDWPHPMFYGGFLPAERSVTNEGFSASWSINEFASNISQLMSRCSNNSCDRMATAALGVKLVDSVDVYLKSERAVKYGFMIVMLVFTAFFVFELIRGLRIHPMQYALVGAAVSVFFLLVISLAEHIGFAVAYLAAASSSLAIIALYLRTVLQAWGNAGFFAGGLAALYGLLFMILKSEDYALLMGSLLCFAMLAGVMLLTRNVDWYSVGNSS